MSLVAKKYAQILLKNAEDDNIKQKIRDELQFFSELTIRDKEFYKFIMSPIIKYSEKTKLLEEILNSKKYFLENIIKNLVLVLVLDKKFDIISKIAHYYNKFMLKEQNKVYAKAIFANEPENGDIVSLKKLVKDNYDLEAEIDYSVDSKLIAGFILDFNGKRYDASLKNLINKIG